ncbi:hypothetical protein EDD11_002452 [Mortierella claussenii]|nr:hypothetical protein EDD11_002452 [Mortierella claussenii]
MFDHNKRRISEDDPQVVDPLVQNKFGLRKNGFQVALFSALNGLLPSTMNRLFEARTKDKDHLDLMLTENGRKLSGYELKVNIINLCDFQDHLEQALKYATYYNIPVYLVNFYLESYLTPALLSYIPVNAFVVNIVHSKDCTRFIVTDLNGNETTVITNDSLPGEDHP